MPALSFSPALSLWTQLGRISPARPLHTLLRSAGYKWRPPHPTAHTPRISRAQDALLSAGAAGLHQRAQLLCERRPGPVPTIVLGGFIPDSTEQVFLLRNHLVRHGSVFYLNYPRCGFSTDMLCAQLDDLVAEIAECDGQQPVVMAVSWGAGLLLEWLRWHKAAGTTPALAGLVIVSPVACVEDLIAPGETKPSTLLGRALKPYLDAPGEVAPETVEKSRAIFTKMFESGAQNKNALRALLTRGELQRLRDAVLGTIRHVDARSAIERVGALRHMQSPRDYFSPALLPLSDAPTLILYAEKEGAVITESSPTRFVFEKAHRAYFPHSDCRCVSNPIGSPVQHASLIFHYFNFLPPIAGFYRQLKTGENRRSA